MGLQQILSGLFCSGFSASDEVLSVQPKVIPLRPTSKVGRLRYINRKLEGFATAMYEIIYVFVRIVSIQISLPRFSIVVAVNLCVFV